MPKIRCRCGRLINLSAIPCPDEFHLLTDMQIDAVDDKTMTTRDLLDWVITESTLGWKCPECRRLIVRWGDDYSSIEFYKPEASDL